MSESSESDLKEKCVLKLNLKGHKKPITGLSFSPDSKHFVSSSEDRNLMVWNLDQTGRSYRFMGHRDAVNGVEYAPNGRILASASQDQMVRVWTANLTGSSTEFRAHTSAIRSVAFSPDSAQILTGSNDKSLKLWTTARKSFVMSFTGHNHWVRCGKFTPDGALVVSCSDDKSVRVWDAKSSQPVHVFSLTSQALPTCISVHKNSVNVAVGMSSGSVRVYDIRMQKIQQHYVLHNFTTDVCWHPCEHLFLTSGKDGKVVFVDAVEGRPLYSVNAHEGAVSAVKFNPEGNLFASGGEDHLVKVWESHFIS